VADPEKLPSGIRALTDYVDDLGIKIGIYSDAADTAIPAATVSRSRTPPCGRSRTIADFGWEPTRRVEPHQTLLLKVTG